MESLTIERPTATTEKKLSLREQILSQPRGKPVPVDMRAFPDWPQNLFMKPPAARAIAAWEQGGIKYGKKGKIEIATSPTRKAELVQMTLCDEDGALVFPGKKDVEEIAKLDAPVVNHLFNAARKVAGQEIEDFEDDEDREEEEGN